MEKIENLEDKIKTEMETLKTKLSTIEEELRVVSNLDKLRSDAAEKRRLLEAEHLSLGARKTASLQNANSVQVSILDLVKSLTSEATPSATQFFKRSYKISHPPGL